MDAVLQSWPVLTSMGGIALVAVLWAYKIFFMLQTVILKIDTIEKNIATHQHEPDGRVVIPAR